MIDELKAWLTDEIEKSSEESFSAETKAQANAALLRMITLQDVDLKMRELGR